MSKIEEKNFGAKDSELVYRFSSAILTVKDGKNMSKIEEKNFGAGYGSWNQLSCTQKESEITIMDFGGLFIFTGLAMIIAVFFNTSVGKKLIVMANDFMPFGGNDSRTSTITTTPAGEAATSEQQHGFQLITNSLFHDNNKNNSNNNKLVQNNVDDIAVEVREGNEPDQQINNNGEIH